MKIATKNQVFIDYLIGEKPNDRKLTPKTAADYENALRSAKCQEFIKKHCDKNCDNIYNVTDPIVLKNWLDILLEKKDFTDYINSGSSGSLRASMKKYIKFLEKSISD